MYDLSVVIPCYNAGRYLEACLKSLQGQELTNAEFIFVDDGSTDGSDALLDEFAENDRRARVLHLENGGVSRARNIAIDMARGRYLAFVDADDALEPGALSRLLALADARQADIVSADHVVVMDGGERREVRLGTPDEDPVEVVGRIVSMHPIYNNLWNKVYSRALFEDGACRLEPDIRIGEDAVLNARLYARARRIAHLPEVLYAYRVHGQSAMAGAAKDYCARHQPMLRGLSRALLDTGLKERFFRAFVMSAMWVREKEFGVRAAAAAFGAQVRALALEGVDPARLRGKNRRAYGLIRLHLFPAWYVAHHFFKKRGGRT